MANIKSQKKRAITNLKRNAVLSAEKSELKTAIKTVLAAVEANDKATATSLYPATVSAIDAAVTKGVIHKNNANNRKAKLAKKLAALN